MNEQVSKFIEEQKKKENQNKVNHLGRLGLYDFDKCKKEYVSGITDGKAVELGCFKDDKGWFKLVGPRYVVQVSDEEYAEICRFCPPNGLDGDDEEKKLFTLGEVLSIITYLAASIIIISTIIILVIDIDSWKIALGILFLGVICVLSALCNSYLLKVIAKISNKLN